MLWESSVHQPPTPSKYCSSDPSSCDAVWEWSSFTLIITVPIHFLIAWSLCDTFIKVMYSPGHAIPWGCWWFWLLSCHHDMCSLIFIYCLNILLSAIVPWYLLRNSMKVNTASTLFRHLTHTQPSAVLLFIHDILGEWCEPWMKPTEWEVGFQDKGG